MIYRLIHQLQQKAISVQQTCRVLVVSRSGYYQYLAAVMDMFSRKAAGWAMAPTMPAELVAVALRMALSQRKLPPGLLRHSD